MLNNRKEGIAMIVGKIKFPEFKGLRCLMMPYIQGNPLSVPRQFMGYADILKSIFVKAGDVGYLTIDESPVVAGTPHRGSRSKYPRALHTEAGKLPGGAPAWGNSWGAGNRVTLAIDTKVLIANNLDNTCAVWDAWHSDTSRDGDIGDKAHKYPYDDAILLKDGEVCQMGIFTPHESLAVEKSGNRQFLRIVGAGVYGREPYFTENPLCPTS